MYSQFGGKVVKRKLSKKKSVRRRSKSSKKTLRKKRSTKKGGANNSFYYVIKGKTLGKDGFLGIGKESPKDVNVIIETLLIRDKNNSEKITGIKRHIYREYLGQFNRKYLGQFHSASEYKMNDKCKQGNCLQFFYYKDKDKDSRSNAKQKDFVINVGTKEDRCKHQRELIKYTGYISNAMKSADESAINSNCSNTTGGAKKRSTKKTVKRRSVSKKTVKRRSVSKKTVKRRSTSKKTRSKRR